jgi:hypothetical protein
VANSGSLMFRPTPVALPGHISVFAHYLDADNVTTSLVDGTIAMYDDSYSNDIDVNDFRKADNMVENLSINNNGVLLAIEKRRSITKDDTIYLKFSKVRVRKYRFTISMNNLATPGIVAMLEDSYLNTKTLLSTSDTTNYDFNIINHPDSYNPFRFKIVLKVLNTLPVSFTAITATIQNNDIKVMWKVSDQLNIAQYEVLKSTNGINFTKIATVSANSGNIANLISYQMLDQNPESGYNFYRIKSKGIAGEIKYSNIVKVDFTKNKPVISIFPNPIEGGVIKLQMHSMPTGIYNASVFNNIGQLIYTQKIVHFDNTLVEKIEAKQFLIPGTYRLEIIKPDHTVVSVGFLKQ